MVYLTSFTFCFGDIIKRNNKKNSGNDQLTGHFQSFFCFVFRSPTLSLKYIQLIQKFWPYTVHIDTISMELSTLYFKGFPVKFSVK